MSDTALSAVAIVLPFDGSIALTVSRYPEPRVGHRTGHHDLDPLAHGDQPGRRFVESCPAFICAASAWAPAREYEVMNDAPSIAMLSACSSDPSKTGSLAWLSKSAIRTETGSRGAAGVDVDAAPGREYIQPATPSATTSAAIPATSHPPP